MQAVASISLNLPSVLHLEMSYQGLTWSTSPTTALLDNPEAGMKPPESSSDKGPEALFSPSYNNSRKYLQ